MEGSRPEITFADGAISIGVWRRQVDGRSLWSISISRSFKTEQGWQRSTSLRAQDLPRAILLLNEAYRWLLQRAKERGETEAETKDI